jgi:hypothetical protein
MSKLTCVNLARTPTANLPVDSYVDEVQVMASGLPSGTRKRPLRFAFSTLTSILAMVAVASSLVLVHDWGRHAIPIIEWICGTSAVLLLASIIADSRRP